MTNWLRLYPSMIVGAFVCSLAFLILGQYLFPSNSGSILAYWMDIIIGATCGALLAYVLAPDRWKISSSCDKENNGLEQLRARVAKLHADAQEIDKQTAALENKRKALEADHETFKKKMKAFEEAYLKLEAKA